MRVRVGLGRPGWVVELSLLSTELRVSLNGADEVFSGLQKLICVEEVASTCVLSVEVGSSRCMTRTTGPTMLTRSLLEVKVEMERMIYHGKS
jgi:hypothetical protein